MGRESVSGELVAFEGVLPKRPLSGNWAHTGRLQLGLGGTLTERWELGGIVALSDVSAPEGKPEWHVSVTDRGGIADALVMAQVRRDFGMVDAQEDNHGKGKARHLWLVVPERDRRPDCHCVNEAPPNVEGEREWRP